jgi:hypothetical protein
MAQKSGAADATAAVPFVSRGIMLWSLGGICGYVAFGFICDVIGRRLTVILIARAYSAGTIAAGLTLYAVAGASVDSIPPDYSPSRVGASAARPVKLTAPLKHRSAPAGLSLALLPHSAECSVAAVPMSAGRSIRTPKRGDRIRQSIEPARVQARDWPPCPSPPPPVLPPMHPQRL